MLLASQGENAVRIEGVSGAAVDACAMRDALIELGDDFGFSGTV